MNLGHQIIKDLLTESPVKTLIVIYPGRFQPMGKHHAEVYKKLASKYGKSNTYIATSDKVALPKSPLNFREKLQVIRKHGIQNVVQVKNPYKAEEITKKYDPTTTAVLFAVGKKDMMENPRFKVGTKKNGEPGYFQHYDKNKNNLQPFTQHGYLVVAPHVSMKIPGYGEMSGTVLRQVLATADQNTFRNIMGWFDPKIFNLLKDKLSQNIKEFLVTSNMSNILNEISKADGSKADVDDGPRYFYGNQATYRKKTADMAKRLGFEVINYIIKDNPIEVHDTKYPDGPPMTVSYFPTGVKGGDFAGTDYIRDYKGRPGYTKWKRYITKVAQQVGYKFLDFLGAEDSIESSKAEVLKPTTLKEDINLPINIGDTVMMGRFKNKKVVVKSINWNDKGDLLINGRSAMRMRIIPQEQSILKSHDEQALTKEWWNNTFKQLLTEGGASGHMNHPFDDRDLTFGQMKEIVRLALDGHLDIESGIQEKTDGQNLNVTFKNGKVGASRNIATTRNPMDVNAVKLKFGGRGDISDAFGFAMEDLEKAILSIPNNKREEIFQNGTRFINLEIIYPATKNVISYGPAAYLQFHGLNEFDLETGKKIKEYPEYGSILQKMIADVNADTQKHFKIIPPRILQTKRLPDFEAKEPYYINRIEYLQKQFNLKDSDEVIMWHEMWWKGKIQQTIPYATDDIKSGLLKRWAYFDKSFRLNSKNIPDPKILQMAKEFDKQDFVKQNKENVYNFEKIFLELGAEVMYNMSNFLAVNPDESIQDLRKQIAKTIKELQSAKNIKALEKLKFELKRIEAIGGLDRIVPAEGIVFMYKGKTYKLTGLFAPINQLLGLARYAGR